VTVARIPDLPDGVLGFRLSGKLTRDDYHDDLARPILDALEGGGRLNLLIEIADDFSGLDTGALWEDVKAVGSIGLKHRTAWERSALVTDKDWIRHGVSVFGWLSPGELRVFEPADLPAATVWVGGGAAG
jgi:SpoIIAA-like